MQVAKQYVTWQYRMSERVRQTLQQIATPYSIEAPKGGHKPMQNNRCSWCQEYVTGKHPVYEVNRKWKCVAEQMQLIKRRTSLPTSTQSL